MADTRIENAIVEAILIITDKRIALAGYDKTIKGVIKDVLDSAAGKYEIKYQDSLLEAYATSSDLSYQTGQMVSVLIPGNDWSRTKTILGGVTNQTLIQNEIPVASNQYNQIGMSATTVNNAIGLSSYKPDGDSIILALNGLSTDNNYLNISSDAYDYIKKGDSLAFKMVVRTSLAPSQVGGDYGVIFRLVFKDGNGLLTIRNYIVSNKHVIGQPYAIQAYTPVEVLYTDIDTLNFIRIDSILAFCEGFPEDENKEDKDIFISGITINGADALNEEALTGYSMHILDPDGTILYKTTVENESKLILLTAQLKSKGKVVTLNVVYYWGIEDGTVFKGSDKYCGWLGDGWRCLNTYDSNLRSYIAFTTPDFYFTTQLPQFDNNDGIRNKALARSKNNNVICVAVLRGNSFSGLILIENQNLAEVKIISSELTETGINKTIYYLDNGHPDLTCYVDDSEETNSYTYKWSIFPRDGKGELKEEKPYPIIDESTGDIIYVDKYVYFKSEWNKVINKLDKIAGNQQSEYKGTAEYINAKDNIELVLSAPYVYKNIYYNFPIKEISGSMKISCTVLLGETYIGTGSIILLNRRLLEGMYSLNIENGTQVFQYDGKGNSPASKQLLKPLLILPLRFTLVDNHGKLITHQQIRLNGWIKWIIPKKQTMISSAKNKDGEDKNGNHLGGATDISVIRADLPLAADLWDVYRATDDNPLDFFLFAIDDRYDFKNNINYIWLNVKYKDIILDAYTDFSFPKDGDPGTNGTDLVAKITPSLSSDRLYISNKNPFLLFNDQGAKVLNLKFLLYNNSNKLDNILANNWTVPPKTKNGDKEDIRTGRKSYLSVSPVSGLTTTVTFSSGTDQKFDGIQTDKPVNIIRAQYGTGNGSGDLRYYAEIPICTNYIKVKDDDYRIKVKPKTGFNYVVYSSDGTSPDYDNTMPFEILVEKLVGLYYMIEQETYTYTFDTIGNLKNGTQNENKYTVLPKDSYNGYDLSSAVICQVKHGSTEIGFIHIPVYMIINRYNNRALNSWDGNSVQIDKNGNGEILTPQIAAGAKDSDNAFTGMLMGQIALNTANDDIGTNGDIGLMGYDSGVRTVFLDAKTGKAEFGKNNQGKIIIDPDTTINGQTAALLYSNTYPMSYFLQHPNVLEVGLYYKTDRDTKGLLIDLSTPQIGFGNGNFTVNSEGHLIARGGGLIAGWNINDNQLHKNNKVGMASSEKTVPTNIGLKIDNNDTTAFWAGGTPEDSTGLTTLTDANFYVTHGGYIYSKRGRIAKWNIDENILLHTDGKVGMGTGSEKTFYYTDSSNNSTSISITNPRFWAINGKKLCIIDNNGKLWANEARIGPWLVDQSKLSNGYTGLGSNLISSTDMNSAFGLGTTSDGVQARIWASTSNTNKSVNFVVTNDGKLYSKAGKIGGWNILENKLWAGSSTYGSAGIQINADGSLTGGLQLTGANAHNYKWSISRDGTATFNNLNANNTGYIAGWKITSDKLEGSTKNSDGTAAMVINSEGSLKGPNWEIDKYGNADFQYINGVVRNTAGQSVSLTGGDYSGAGGGYYLNSDGTFGFGSSGGNKMIFDGETLDIGPWSIGAEGIYNKSDNDTHIYPSGISIKSGNNITNITGNSVISEAIQAKDHFSLNSAIGKTGRLTFTDGSYINISGGIITYVKGGLDAIYDGN